MALLKGEKVHFRPIALVGKLGFKLWSYFLVKRL